MDRKIRKRIFLSISLLARPGTFKMSSHDWRATLVSFIEVIRLLNLFKTIILGLNQVVFQRTESGNITDALNPVIRE
jgi:hypothetical protein